MTEKERKIMETFGRVIPKMSDQEKENLLAFGEGMALIAGRRAQPGA